MNVNGCNTHFVIKQEDAQKHLLLSEYSLLMHFMDRINIGRATDGKEYTPQYYVVNKDEALADQIKEVIERNI